MRDTHILIDERGVPLLRGTLAEMIEQQGACLLLGISGVTVEPVRLWDWTMINWGD
jgi:hypothetical protein